MAETPTNDPIDPHDLSPAQKQRATACLIGSALGDALGAHFEFDGPGRFSLRFPRPVLTGTAEMLGGGGFGWAPGEFTDDTQMALVLAQSLVANGLTLDGADLFARFVVWASAAADVGNTTRAALGHSDWRTAAAAAHERLRGRTGSNGGLMRVAPVAVAGTVKGETWTREAAHQQAALTHFDPAAGFAAAVAAVIMRRSILSGTLASDLEALVRDTGAALSVPTGTIESFVLAVAEGFDPVRKPFSSNGGALQCFAEALWAVRATSSFEDALRAAVDLGGDTDTVAAVAGAFGGALYGQQRLPIRWTTHVHGTVQTPSGPESFVSWDLLNIGHRLLGLPAPTRTAPEPPIEPVMVHDAGVWASNLAGATDAHAGCAVVSLCITDRLLAGNPHRREVFLRDEPNSHNPHLADVVRESVEAIRANLREGREVLVHCHGGRSRTGLILKAWYMKHHDTDHLSAHEWLEAVWPHYVTWTPDFWDFLEYSWPVLMQEVR